MDRAGGGRQLGGHPRAHGRRGGVLARLQQGDDPGKQNLNLLRLLGEVFQAEGDIVDAVPKLPRRGSGGRLRLGGRRSAGGLGIGWGVLDGGGPRDGLRLRARGETAGAQRSAGLRGRSAGGEYAQEAQLFRRERPVAVAGALQSEEVAVRLGEAADLRGGEAQALGGVGYGKGNGALGSAASFHCGEAPFTR